MKDNKAILNGLTSAEVEERIKNGKVNTVNTVKTKSIGRIFYDNICTVFNLINVILCIILLFIGSYKNMLFIMVVVFNTVIGIIQEIRSKKSVDNLTILTDSKVDVIRDGRQTKVSRDELVLDDVIILSRGSQVPADCVVIDGTCMADESLLTGESDLIDKAVGSELLSGSFVSGGSCKCRITRVGDESYAAKINNEAKYVKKNESQILRSFKFIINVCSVVIFPVGALMFVSKYLIQHQELNPTLESTVGALVGMIPSGMVLLTSTVLAVAVIRLSKKKVLVNEMHCIETLARVDVLCLDKTGTLTTETMNVQQIVPLSAESGEIDTALASIAAASEDINATLQAVSEYTKDTKPLKCTGFIPFSSETKRSGGSFENGKTYFIGAAEFLFPNKSEHPEVFDAIQKITDTVRILALASSDAIHPDPAVLPDDLKPMALVLIKDQLRSSAKDTIAYFKEQGVTLKVISGDSVGTVMNIAADVGIDGASDSIDMSTVTTEEQLKEAAERCSVFGRVTPAQKKQLVIALKEKGHKVAMTGDGVNDVLALKEADCSVAMAAGSEAARNVSQLVLVNNDFACMPHVVAEGRRSINNIERSSSLYLVKTIYSIIMSVFFVFFHMTYPFQPIHLSLMSALTVGFPSFVLALQPNKNIVRGNFTFNIIARAAPAALCVASDIIIAALLSGATGVSSEEFSTIAVYITALIGVMLIIRLCIPFNPLRAGMLTITVLGLFTAFIFFGWFFNLTVLSNNAWIMFAILAAATVVIFNLLYNLADKYIEKYKRQPLGLKKR